MCDDTTRPNVLYVDPLAADRSHLLNDDLFLAECLVPLTGEFLVATCPTSAANLRRHLPVAVRETRPVDQDMPLLRLGLLRNLLALPCSRSGHVVFQSFEEVTTLIFMLLHPRQRVHVIATSNLRPERLKRHPVLGRFFLRAVFRRAASIIVHCRYEADRITKLVPGLDPAKIFVKPFHQMSRPRVRLSVPEKARTILFVGPECEHKKVDRVVDLIKRDKERRYQYYFCAMSDNLSPQTRAFLNAQENVVLSFGYVAEDDYYRLFREASFVILTHDENYEGALSGVFCDAIASGTPVIARDMAPYDEFFERFGSMGFLVDYANPQWCEQVLAVDPAERYAEFQGNMAACRESCSMEAIRSVFRAALSRA